MLQNIIYLRYKKTSDKNSDVEGKNVKKERRTRDSNPHELTLGGFQDRCNTNYASPPNVQST